MPRRSIIKTVVATGHVEGGQCCPLAAAKGVFPWDISQVWSDTLQDFSTNRHCREDFDDSWRHFCALLGLFLYCHLFLPPGPK